MTRRGSTRPAPPRRGRHRTTVPARLVAAVAALLVTGGVVVAAGQAAADSDPDSSLLSALTDFGDDSEGSEDDGEETSDEEASDDEASDSDGDGADDGSDGEGAPDPDDPDDRGDNSDARNTDGNSSGNQGEQGGDDGSEGAEEQFPGRGEAGPPSADSYVDITDVPSGDPGEGGAFADGSYTVDCGVGDHRNSDNYMAAPGKRNGAQHVHDYVGNTTTDAFSDADTLEEGRTSCGNGDRSTFFWPVLRDLNGTGPDVGEDGGSLDGNEGSIMTPESVDLTFHGHGDEPVEPIPAHLMMIMGNAKAGTAGGENANAKYTCTGYTDQITDQYPICPSGSQLVRFLDYPSCWDGENLDSEDLRSHVSYPDRGGNCADGETPIPALRITLTYDQPDGRSFAIDSFPNQQHDPITDHSDVENLASEDANEAGADCINENRTCANLRQ